MELDIKYKQYELQSQHQTTEENDVTDEKTLFTKPYQEVINYLQENISKIDYQTILPLLSSVQTHATFTLDDGSSVLIAKSQGLINLSIKYKNNSRFIACWTNISDEKEYFEALKKMKNT